MLTHGQIMLTHGQNDTQSLIDYITWFFPFRCGCISWNSRRVHYQCELCSNLV